MTSEPDVSDERDRPGLNAEGRETETTAELEFDEFVRYTDGDGTVICDRRNPAAWIRSTVVRRCRR